MWVSYRRLLTQLKDDCACFWLFLCKSSKTGWKNFVWLALFFLSFPNTTKTSFAIESPREPPQTEQRVILQIYLPFFLIWAILLSFCTLTVWLHDFKEHFLFCCCSHFHFFFFGDIFSQPKKFQRLSILMQSFRFVVQDCDSKKKENSIFFVCACRSCTRDCTHS